MIRAIVFDLGGVLFAEGKAVAAEQLARKHGYNPGLVNQIFYSQKSLELRKGLITDDEFWTWVQAQLPKNRDALLIKELWYQSYVLDEDVFELVKKLKGKYKIVAFSGNIRSRIDFLEKKYGFRKFFNAEVYSFDHQRTKPDREFTIRMVQECGCRPEEIVYIDDNERYVWPARDLGIRVLIYSRGETIKLEKELKSLGVGF